MSRRRSRALEQRIITEIRRLESIFSIFEPQSDINQFRNSGETDCPELNEVWELAQRWQKATAGAFSPHIAGLHSAWAQAEREQRTPDQATIVTLLDNGKSLSQLNLNAIAKGWIVDRAREIAFAGRRKPSSCWVSIGGDIAHRGAGAITVGIEDPFRPFDNAEPITQIRLSGRGLATSGGARRHWVIGGRKFSHVVDPRSGWPVDHIASVTVVAPDTVTADVLATATTVLQPNESLRLIDDTPGASCLIVGADETISTSSRWPGADALQP